MKWSRGILNIGPGCLKMGTTITIIFRLKWSNKEKWCKLSRDSSKIHIIASNLVNIFKLSAAIQTIISWGHHLKLLSIPFHNCLKNDEKSRVVGYFSSHLYLITQVLPKYWIYLQELFRKEEIAIEQIKTMSFSKNWNMNTYSILRPLR